MDDLIELLMYPIAYLFRCMFGAEGAKACVISWVIAIIIGVAATAIIKNAMHEQQQFTEKCEVESGYEVIHDQNGKRLCVKTMKVD